MTCQHATLPGGFSAIVCTKTQRCKCGSRATLLCDWKVDGKKSGTCDAPMCRRCATNVTPNRDLCVKHVKAYAAWKEERAQADG